MNNRRFQMIETNGVTLRTVVEGEGPLVILLHGWPEGWHIWRHQIAPLVAAGYCVAVPDQRGYGGSSKPDNLNAYRIDQLCADVDGIRDALGYVECVVVGQDFGCVIAWVSALLYPETCRGVVGFSIPFWRFSVQWADRPGAEGNFWYMKYFQQDNVPEMELDRDIETSLHTIYHSLCADSPPGVWMNQLSHSSNTPMLDALPKPNKFSDWMSEDHWKYCVEQFQEGGFGPPLNWYRNILAGAKYMETNDMLSLKILQPAAFAIGEMDDVGEYNPNWRKTFPTGFEDLRFLEIVDGAGHFVQAEKPVETTTLILKFLDSLSTD